MPNDYDAAWKEFLHSHLRQALELYFPDIASAIDWSNPPEFLEQELHRLNISEASGQNIVDLLIKARTVDGASEILFLHIEIQSSVISQFEARTFRSFCQARMACGENVITLVILADLNPSWRPTEYWYARLGCNVRFRFPTCKLLDLPHDLDGTTQSLATLAAQAQIEGLRHSGNPDNRFAVRWRLTRLLYEQGYSREDIITAYKMIARMLRLPDQHLLTYKQLLLEYERGRNMNTLTDIEELAIKTGMEQGLEQGLEQGRLKTTQSDVIRILNLRFGQLDDGLEALLLKIDNLDRLSVLLDEAILASSLESFSEKLRG
ncbi:MAG: hypothetical protein ACFCU3_01935 [Verrucomicrobiales bacterium]